MARLAQWRSIVQSYREEDEFLEMASSALTSSNSRATSLSDSLSMVISWISRSTGSISSSGLTTSASHTSMRKPRRQMSSSMITVDNLQVEMAETKISRSKPSSRRQIKANPLALISIILVAPLLLCQEDLPRVEVVLRESAKLDQMKVLPQVGRV